MAKLFYKPFALIGAAIAARVGRSAFKSVWSRLDSSEPPSPTTEETTMPKAVGAATLEAATMAGVGAAFERGTAHLFHYLFGVWPGPREPEGEEE